MSKNCCQNTSCGNTCQCSVCQNTCQNNCWNGCGNWNCGDCGSWGCGNWNCGGCGNWNCGGCGNWGCGSCGNCGSCGGWGCTACTSDSSWPGKPPVSPGGLLVPRIVASGRTLQRNVQLELCITDLPEDAQAPYTLISLSACGSSDWELLPGSGRNRTMRVTIPVVVQLRDRCGAIYMVHSSITVDVPIRVGLPGQDPCRGTVTVLPGIRLVCAPVCSEDSCFIVTIDVVVDVYVTKWEPSGESITAPCRPDLPLTLPMNFPTCT